MVENRKIFIPHLYLAPPKGSPRRNFVKTFQTRKTRMMGLQCSVDSDDMLSHFDTIPGRNGQT